MGVVLRSLSQWGIRLQCELPFALTRSAELPARSSSSFRSACGRAGYFLLFGQEKVTKEKATPNAAPYGHPALRVRSRSTGSADSTSVYCSGIGAIPRAAPSGLSSVREPRLTGPRKSGAHRARQKQQQSNSRAVHR